MNDIIYNNLDIWRKVIGFFKKTSRYPSPYKDAGYSYNKIEPLVQNKTPDIISTKKNSCLITDITCNDDKDLVEMVKTYSALDPENIIATIASPDIINGNNKVSILIIGIPNSVDQEKSKLANCSCFRIVPTCQYFKGNNFHDTELEIELNKLNDKTLEPPPLSLLAVPESNGIELKLAIVAVLLKRIPEKDTTSDKFKPYDLVSDILFNEIDLFSSSSKKKLAKKIRKKLIHFSQNNNILKFIQKEDAFYFSGKGSKSSTKKILENWANDGQVGLEEFS